MTAYIILTIWLHLKEPLLVQKQTLHQQKALDISYLEPEVQGRGTIKRRPLPLAAKDIGKKSKFDGAKSGYKKKIFNLIFNILLL